MNIVQNVNLQDYSTMRLGGTAAYMTEITSRFDVPKALEWAKQNSLPVLMIGSGSNTIWQDGVFNGLLMVNKIMGIEQQVDPNNLYLTVGAGEIWDDVAARSVALNFSGIETLSMIPGTAGAGPIQNIGAYGSELADNLVSVEVYDTHQETFTTLPASDCGFGYRTSRFKTTHKGRFFITGLSLHLTQRVLNPPFYPALQHYFTEHGITTFTPEIVRKSVMAIRSFKLPDPAVIVNCGSFYANPVIDESHLSELLKKYPTIVYWHLDGGKIKLSAAWLLENAGFKDYHDQSTGMATSDKQALVLINESAKNTADLIAFSKLIEDTVYEKYDITLEREPVLLP